MEVHVIDFLLDKWADVVDLDGAEGKWKRSQAIPAQPTAQL